jgi:hypothetical protein
MAADGGPGGVDNLSIAPADEVKFEQRTKEKGGVREKRLNPKKTGTQPFR